LQFENHRDWTAQNWKKVLFFDESKFKLFENNIFDVLLVPDTILNTKSQQ